MKFFGRKKELALQVEMEKRKAAVYCVGAGGHVVKEKHNLRPPCDAIRDIYMVFADVCERY